MIWHLNILSVLVLYSSTLTSCGGISHVIHYAARLKLLKFLGFYEHTINCQPNKLSKGKFVAEH